MNYKQEIKNKITELFDSMPESCTSVGYGYKEKNGKLTKEKSIIFTFEEKKPLSELLPDEIVPNKIRVGDVDITTDVQQGINKFTGFEACPVEFYLWSDDTNLNPSGQTAPSNTNVIRPLKGGLKIRNLDSPYYGTMGFIAVDNDTNSLVGVTNSHVMNVIQFRADEPDRMLDGDYSNVYNDDMSQPTSSDNIVGKTKRYFPVVSSARGRNYIDAALFSIDSDNIDFNESFKYEGLTFSEAPTFATTEEIDSLLDNDWDLFSSGARTGAKGQGNTKLKVSSLFNTVSVPGILIFNSIYSNSGNYITYDDCIGFVASASTTTSGNTCFYPLNSGDSGSALLADINGQLKIIGLVFAGTDFGLPDDYFRVGYACRIDKISEILNISPFTGQTDVNFSNVNNPQVQIVDGASSLTAITINNIKYYQLGTYIPD